MRARWWASYRSTTYCRISQRRSRGLPAPSSAHSTGSGRCAPRGGLAAETTAARRGRELEPGGRVLNIFGSGKPDHPMADIKEARTIVAEIPGNDSLQAIDALFHWLES